MMIFGEISFSFCFRDRQGAKQPVPDQRLRQGAAHPAGRQRSARHPHREGLRPRQRSSRGESFRGVGG